MTSDLTPAQNPHPPSTATCQPPSPSPLVKTSHSTKPPAFGTTRQGNKRKSTSSYFSPLLQSVNLQSSDISLFFVEYFKRVIKLRFGVLLVVNYEGCEQEGRYRWRGAAIRVVVENFAGAVRRTADGRDAGIGGDPGQPVTEAGAGPLLFGFAPIHVDRGRVLQLHCFLVKIQQNLSFLRWILLFRIENLCPLFKISTFCKFFVVLPQFREPHVSKSQNISLSLCIIH